MPGLEKLFYAEIHLNVTAPMGPIKPAFYSLLCRSAGLKVLGAAALAGPD